MDTTYMYPHNTKTEVYQQCQWYGLGKAEYFALRMWIRRCTLHLSIQFIEIKSNTNAKKAFHVTEVKTRQCANMMSAESIRISYEFHRADANENINS
jgi:hypothetical protein